MEDQLKTLQKTIAEVEGKIRSIAITPKGFREEIETMDAIFNSLTKLVHSVISDTMTIPSKFLMQKIISIEFLGILSDIAKFNIPRSKTFSAFRQGKLSEYTKGELVKALSEINGAINTDFKNDPSSQTLPKNRGYVEIPTDYKDYYFSQTKKYTFNKDNSVINQVQFSTTDTSSSRRVKYVAKGYGFHAGASSFSFSSPQSSALARETSSNTDNTSISSASSDIESDSETSSTVSLKIPVLITKKGKHAGDDKKENDEEEKKDKTKEKKEKEVDKDDIEEEVKEKKEKKEKKIDKDDIEEEIKEKKEDKDDREEEVKERKEKKERARSRKEKKDSFSKLRSSLSFKIKQKTSEKKIISVENTGSPDISNAQLSREDIISEIISSEKAYTEGLKLLITAYKAPLLHENHFITDAEADLIFGNLEMLSNLHERLFKTIEKDTKGDTIGKTFLPYIQFFKSYTEYGRTYEKGNSLLHKLKRSNLDFRKFAEKVGKQYGNFQGTEHLEGLLISPFQRLSKYNVLLSELATVTEKEHPDYDNIIKAKDLMTQVSDVVNKSKFGENKLMNIQLMFSDTDTGGLVSKTKPLVQPHRELVLESDFVLKDRKSGDTSIHVILCNDVIVFTKKKRLSSVLTFMFCEPIGNCMASMRGESKCELLIQYGLSENDNVIIEASSEDERNAWFKEINGLCKKVNKQYNEKVMRVVSSTNTEDEATLKAEAVFNQEIHTENLTIFDSIVVEIVDEILEMSS